MNASAFNDSEYKLDDEIYDDEDECDFSKHRWLFAKFVLTSVIGTCVAICGIFGNLNTIAVLIRPQMRTPNNLFLTALAIFDTSVLISAVLLYSIEYVQEYFDDVQLYLTWINAVPYLYALSNFAQTGSVYVTVSVTFERYLAVVHPRISQTQCTKVRAMLTILIASGFAAAFNISKFFEITITRNENCTGFASRGLEPSELLMDPLYNKVYTLWLTQFIMVFFPFGVLLTINTAIVWNFKKSLKRLNCTTIQLDRGLLKRQSRDATRVLVIIVVVFLICNCWSFVITLMESMYGAIVLSQWAPKFYAFSREAINFLAIVNSSINFFICIAFSDDFRYELLIMYGFRPPRRRSSKQMKRRRNGFSDGRRGSRASRSSIIRLGGVFRMRYVDRMNSVGSLMLNGDSSSRRNSTTNSQPVSSFNALIEAARTLITRTLAIHQNDQKEGRKEEQPVEGILDEKYITKFGMNGRVSEDKKSPTNEPFLHSNSFISRFEMDWEATV